MKKSLILLFIMCLPLGGVYAQIQRDVFTPKQSQYISCAKEKLFILYNFLDTTVPIEKKTVVATVCSQGKEVQISPPQWFIDDWPVMEGRKLWEITNAATGRKEYLSEAEMWRRAIHATYEVIALAERINEGSAYTQQEVVEMFGVIRTNLMMDLDRLNVNPAIINFNMRDSMRGRGRSWLATLKLINSEMDSIAESFVSPASQWKDKFRKSVIGIAVLSGNMYYDVMKAPHPLMPTEVKIQRPNLILISVLMFLGALAVFFSAYQFISDRNDEINTAVARYMQRSAAWADDYSRQFLNINVKFLVLGTLGAFTLLGLLFALVVGGLMSVVMFLLCFGLGLYVSMQMPRLMLDILKRRRGEKINGQLMDALILLSNSLKSGMDIVQGFDMVSRDLRPPISEEFALVIKNYQLGTPFERALEGMEERVESRLLSYMVKAIVLQRQVGGNLTKIFERIVENIREESKLEDKLQAMTAQQRIQALVVGIMPWVMVGVMFVFQPDTMINFYTKPVGIIVLFFCIFWIGCGIKMVNKLGEIKV